MEHELVREEWHWDIESCKTKKVCKHHPEDDTAYICPDCGKKIIMDWDDDIDCPVIIVVE